MKGGRQACNLTDDNIHPTATLGKGLELSTYVFHSL